MTNQPSGDMVVAQPQSLSSTLRFELYGTDLYIRSLLKDGYYLIDYLKSLQFRFHYTAVHIFINLNVFANTL